MKLTMREALRACITDTTAYNAGDTIHRIIALKDRLEAINKIAKKALKGKAKVA